MKRLRSLILGPPRDPLDPEISQRVLLAAMLAWVGFGANGLSSALYGPEKAYVALGTHTELAPLLAIATTATVFVIALAYSQVGPHGRGSGPRRHSNGEVFRRRLGDDLLHPPRGRWLRCCAAALRLGR